MEGNLKYNKEEKTLVVLGNILLIVGFIAAIFLLVSVFEIGRAHV